MADIFGIGGIVGGLLGYKGQKSANQSNERIAQEQEDFQREMSNTSYQRAVSDMQLAGLNPMLAYQQGGASTPAGATGAPQQNELGAGVSTAVQAAGAIAGLENTAANTDKAKADAAVAAAAVPKVTAEARSANASAAAAEYQVKELLPISMRKELNLLGSSSYQGAADTFRESQLKDRMKAELSGIQSEARRQSAEALLAEYSGSEGRAYSEFYEGAGKYAPYIDTAGSVVNSAGRIARMMSPGWSVAHGYRGNRRSESRGPR